MRIISYKINPGTLLVVLTFALTAFGQNTNSIPLPTNVSANNEFRFAAIGDAGTGKKKQLKLARKMLEIQQKTDFSLVLFLGDNVYENGSPKDFEKKFLKPYGSLFRNNVELRGVIGNHDARSKNGVLLQQMIFRMGGKTFYSFSKNNNLIEFFGLNSTLLAKKKNLAQGNEQVKWFEERVTQSKARWKITFMHHPLYSSAKRHGLGAGDEDEMLRVRKKLEPIMAKHGVKVSLHGHDHVYERTKPQKKIQYFTSGAGGKLRKGNLQTDSPFYAFGNDKEHSFLLFSVKMDEITFWAIDSDGKILDSGKIQH